MRRPPSGARASGIWSRFSAGLWPPLPIGFATDSCVTRTAATPEMTVRVALRAPMSARPPRRVSIEILGCLTASVGRDGQLATLCRRRGPLKKSRDGSRRFVMRGRRAEGQLSRRTLRAGPRGRRRLGPSNPLAPRRGEWRVYRAKTASFNRRRDQGASGTVRRGRRSSCSLQREAQVRAARSSDIAAISAGGVRLEAARSAAGACRDARRNDRLRPYPAEVLRVARQVSYAPRRPETARAWASNPPTSSSPPDVRQSPDVLANASPRRLFAG